MWPDEGETDAAAERARQLLLERLQRRDPVAGHDVVARSLALHGVTHVYGVPGRPIDPTLASCRREGIRVSGVNAGRIRTGLLTDDVTRQRAAARGISTDQYMSGNLRGGEVTAKAVAGAFLHLAQLDKVNAAVLTVDAGDMATALR